MQVRAFFLIHMSDVAMDITLPAPTPVSRPFITLKNKSRFYFKCDSCLTAAEREEKQTAAELHESEKRLSRPFRVSFEDCCKIPDYYRYFTHCEWPEKSCEHAFRQHYRMFLEDMKRRDEHLVLIKQLRKKKIYSPYCLKLPQEGRVYFETMWKRECAVRSCGYVITDSSSSGGSGGGSSGSSSSGADADSDADAAADDDDDQEHDCDNETMEEFEDDADDDASVGGLPPQSMDAADTLDDAITRKLNICDVD